jgi:hypothetical protein
MLVGHFSDDKLLDLLSYRCGEMHSELCGPDTRSVMWEIRRFSGTIGLDRFNYSYREDGTKAYANWGSRQGNFRSFQALLSEQQIVRDHLRWFPWYPCEQGAYRKAELPWLVVVVEGATTPWGKAQVSRKVTGGVYWVTTATQEGFMIAVHRAAQLLSQAALSLGKLFGPWLCYDTCACAVVIYEHQEWADLFSIPDPVRMARDLLEQYYPHYLMQAASRKQALGRYG